MRKIFTILAVVVALAPLTANAATITVSHTTDELDAGYATDCDPGNESDCSLREAIETLNDVESGDFILSIPAGTYTIALPNSSGDEDSNQTGDFDIDFDGDSLTIQGAGVDDTIISGDDAYRVFEVENFSTGNLVMSHMSIVDGNSANAAESGLAAGGGAIKIESDSTTEIRSMSFLSNTGSFYAGAVALRSSGEVTVTSSQFYGNSVNSGGGIGVYNSTLHVIDSLFDSNTVNYEGGAIYAYQDAYVNIVNSTFYNNVAGRNGSGVTALAAGSSYTVLVDIAHSTFFVDSDDTENNSILYADQSSENETATITSSNSVYSIDTSETDVVCGIDGGTIVSGNYNVSDDDSCSFAGDNDLENTDPLLDTEGLSDNGGTLETIALQSSSPAIDLVPADSCVDYNNASVEEDARGFTRPENTNCDAGAYEVDQTNPTISLSPSTVTLECVADDWSAPTVTVSDNFDSTITSASIQSNAVDVDIVGTYNVVYITAADYDGNTGTATQSVSVQDTTDPTITVVGDTSLTLTAGDTYTEQGATATDTCDSSVSVTTSGTVDTDTAGTYTVTYSTEDNEGNGATATRTVTVEEEEVVADVTVTGVTALTNSRVRVTYSDGTTRTITAFASGSQKPRAKLTADGERVVVLKRNGRNVRVFDAFTGDRLRGKKLRTKSQKRAYLKLVEKNGKEYVVVVTKKGNTIRTTLMRLTAETDKLLNTNTKKLTYKKSNFRVQIKNTRIRIKTRSGTVKRVYKITNTHKLKKVS